MVEIYFRLFLLSLVPIGVSLIIYFLKKKVNVFKKIPFIWEQIIIGIIFGLVAIFGTEVGVDTGGGTANIRDAGPLCAGLLFGGPAGIIAGIIGGIERYVAVFWGRGDYSQIACSLSTIIAGLYAAVLRRFLFNKKRPPFIICFFIGVVMEIVHLLILFLTHLEDPQHCLSIIESVGLPMITAVAFSVMVPSFVIYLVNIKTIKKKKIKLSNKIQTWMLLFTLIAFVTSVGFVALIETNAAINDTENLLRSNIVDVQEDVKYQSDTSILEKLDKVRFKLEHEYQEINDDILADLAYEYDVTEINYVNEWKHIMNTTTERNRYLNMASNKQADEFNILLDVTKPATFVQEYQPSGFFPDERMKYGGIRLDLLPGYIQIGYDSFKFNSEIGKKVESISTFRHVGSEGVILIANENEIIVSSKTDYQGKTLEEIGLKIHGKAENTLFEAFVGKDNIKTFAMFGKEESFFTVTIIPQYETFASRDMTLYITSFVQILGYAILFLLIYILLNKLVVKNVASINNSLENIVKGNLNTKVDIRDTRELDSLSDGINTTVSRLNDYIVEANTRIDKELAFAKAIQNSAMPSIFPAFPTIEEFDIFAKMYTAKEVGGDFYDFFLIDEKHVAFLIADVSGKGIPAAMFMMECKTMIKNLANTDIPVNEVITKANSLICENNDAGMFVTCWIGILNFETGEITFTNAGHNPPLLAHKKGDWEFIEQNKDLVIGGINDYSYRIQNIKLKDGDRLFLYTDGVNEATDINDELFGDDRLKQALNKNKNKSIFDEVNGVKEDIDGFVLEREQFDDITMLIIEFKGKGKKN